MKWYEACCALLIMTLTVLHQSAAAPAAPKEMISNISICIANCAQCHDIIGDIFDHRLCSKDCVRRKGTFSPDCTSPSAIKEYLSVALKSALLNSK